MANKLFVLMACALLIPLAGAHGDEAVCVSVSAGEQTDAGTASFANVGQTIIGVTTDGNVEVLAGIMHCLLVSGLSPAGDCDVSLFVDLPDLQTLTKIDCMLGPDLPFSDAGCSCTDYNEDGHIDLLDAAAFQLAVD